MRSTSPRPRELRSPIAKVQPASPVAGRGVFSARLSALLAALVLTAGCGADVPDVPGAPGEIGRLSQALCQPMNAGGDIGCGCTLNSQCTGFDDDTRLLVCDVASGMSAGTCLDCTAATARPVGCACAADTDCATGSVCNGRTCQALRARGEFCVRTSDCGSDIKGALRCLPTKSWCGPLEDEYPCDFNSDCLSGVCTLGICASGATGARCGSDDACAAPLVCSGVTGTCAEKQPDGKPCTRNAECQTRCNSFSGLCSPGLSGTVCTPGNPDGDCDPAFECTDCGGAYTCRAPGGPCG